MKTMAARAALTFLFTSLALLRSSDSQNLCTFGNFASRDSCGFKSERAVSLKVFEWTFGIACTPSPNTGPCQDHTGDNKGAYLFTESSYKSNGMVARWASPQYAKNGSDSGGCVQFYYHMYGADIGSLNVYVYFSDNSKITWTKSGEQGNIWLRADIELDYPAGDTRTFQVVFEGVVSFSNKAKFADIFGDIAIDDVLIRTSGSCGNTSETAPPTTIGSSTTSSATPTGPVSSDTVLSCDFERDFCGFTQSSADKGYWSRTKGKTLTADTGPSQDNTYKNASGYYLYFFAASTVRQGDTAILNSPQFAGGRCMTFFYNMNGADVNQLNVYADVDALDYAIWSANGNMGDKWIPVTLSLPDDTVAVSFEGVRGVTSKSDIAIDDVTIFKTPCPGATQPSMTPPPTSTTMTAAPQPPAFFACNFDNGKDMCGFSSSGDFQWKQYNRKLRAIATGPSFDHTKQDFRGYYVMADAGLNKNFSIAKFTSPAIGISGTINMCLKFYYHMYGADMGILLARVLSSDGKELATWTQTGDKGDQWLLANVELRAPTTTSLILEFTAQLQHNKGNLQTVLSNFAIDDVIIVTGACVSYPGDFVVDTQVLVTSSPTATPRTDPTPAVTPKADTTTPKPVGPVGPGSTSSTSRPFVPIVVGSTKKGSQAPATAAALASPDPDDGMGIGTIVAIVLGSTAVVCGIVIIGVLKLKQIGPFRNSKPFTIHFKPSNSKVDKMSFANDGYDGGVSIHSAA